MKETFKFASGGIYCAADFSSFHSETAMRTLISFIHLLRMEEMKFIMI